MAPYRPFASQRPVYLAALALLFWAAQVSAQPDQSAGSRSSVPQTHGANAQTPDSLDAITESQGAAQGGNSGSQGNADLSQTTMFPHPEEARYWISGQANVIFQGRLPFHSLYQGPNSFRNSAEYKTSLVETLYTAVRPTRSIRYNTDLILDFESAGGRGLSEALGLAGFTNLDVVRNPSLGTKPYIAPLRGTPGHRADE